LTQVNYVAVTPCKNEEKTINKCVQSVLKQTIPPKAYVVVNDGSTDKTPDILKRFQPKVTVITRPVGSPRTRGSHHRNLLLTSSKFVTEMVPEWDFLITIDADEILAQDYMEKILQKTKENPKLGITSGIPYTKIDGGYRKIYNASNNVWNGARIYRRECWEDLHPIPSIQGWDMWVQFEAVRKGWNVKPFDNINFYEERPWGGTTIQYWIRRGFARKRLGFSTLTHLLTCIMRLTHKPVIIGAIAFFLSFVLYGIGTPKYFDQDYYKFVKKHTHKFALNWLTIQRIMKKIGR
jgi:glycosyltransferase involved in cell wall biosynthesis